VAVEAAPSVDGTAAWRRRARHEAELLAVWRRARPEARRAPAWIGQLVLAADQFVARRRLAEDAEGTTVVAGYHWFGDWGRDTMIALPGLTLVTGRPDVTRRVRSEEHTSELQSLRHLVCRLLLEKKKDSDSILRQ